jgi:hypothetical protein
MSINNKLLVGASVLFHAFVPLTFGEFLL